MNAYSDVSMAYTTHDKNKERLHHAKANLTLTKLNAYYTKQRVTANDRGPEHIETAITSYN